MSVACDALSCLAEDSVVLNTTVPRTRLRASHELNLTPEQQMLDDVVWRHRYLALLHLCRRAAAGEPNVSEGRDGRKAVTGLLW